MRRTRLYRATLVPLLGLAIVALAAFAEALGDATTLRPSVSGSVLLGLVPLAGLCGLSLLVPLRADDFERLYRWKPVPLLLTAALLMVAMAIWVTRVPSGSRRAVAAALAVVITLELAAIVFRRFDLLLSAAALALVASLVGAVEWIDGAARPVVWGGPSTMARPFPREPPYIGPGGRLRPSLDARMIRSSPENLRRVTIRTNRLGFRNDEEFEIPIDGDSPAFLSLGDSFSNGFGISQEDFYGTLLARFLSDAASRPIRVMNAEVSDPCYGLHYLETYGLAYRPDVVLYNLSGNDAVQSLWGCGDGGIFRLTTEGSLPRLRAVARPGKGHRYEDWGQLIYPRRGNPDVERAHGARQRMPALLEDFLGLRLVDRLRVALSAFALPDESPRNGPAYRGELPPSSAASIESDGYKRLFDGFPGIGMAYEEPQATREEALQMLFALLAAMDERASSVGARFVVVSFPQRHEVDPRDWQALRRRWNLDARDFDLDLSTRRIRQFARQRGIPFVDLTEAFRAAGERENLFLPYDGHPNEAGHEVAAATVASALQP